MTNRSLPAAGNLQIKEDQTTFTQADYEETILNWWHNSFPVPPSKAEIIAMAQKQRETQEEYWRGEGGNHCQPR